MRSRRRKQPCNHILVAGQHQDLPAIRSILHALPSDTYGQIYVEASPEEVATLLPTPPRVTVTALAPTGRAGAAVAAAAWLTEWIPDEPQPDREFTVWIGAGVGARLDALCASHDIEPGRL